MLDLDFSLLLIFILVWTLMIVLDRIFFRPLGRVIDERENRVRVDSERLTALLAEAEKKTRSIEESLRDARRVAAQAKEELIRRGEATRSELANQARDQASRLLEEKMAELERGISAAEEKLQTNIAVFSGQIRQAFL